MRSTVGAGAAALLLLGGCATQACSAMGCRGSVGVELGRLGRAGGPPLTTRLCAGEQCTTQTFSPADASAVARVELPTTDGDAPPPSAAVTLRVTQGPTVLVDAAATASLSRFAPNGDGCDPICWSAALTLQEGRLVPSPSG
jgi:hypothetical protein